MVGARTNDGEQPQYDLDDTEILFSFRVHHGGGYDGEMENYIGGKFNFFDYLNLDELSMLDLDDIALELGYKLPIGFWIQMSGQYWAWMDVTPKFKRSMERMRSASEDAYKWLQDKDPNHWSLAFITNTALCDMLCNNMCEAFNSTILNARDKPVISMMEMIKNYLMKRLVRKRAELERWKHEIGPKVFKLVEKVKLESNICCPEYCGNHKYQVRGYGDEQYVVDIQNRTCACNKWQLTGMPCIHGMSALLNSNHGPIQFVHNMYTKETFMKASNPVIHGINGPTMWPNTNEKPVQVPEFKKQRGRPNKARNLQSDEGTIRPLVRKGKDLALKLKLLMLLNLHNQAKLLKLLMLLNVHNQAKLLKLLMLLNLLIQAKEPRQPRGKEPTNNLIDVVAFGFLYA
ncbi:hypothetical protein Ddye_008870 [Dipteronia dyeriana]|uniref:SWIM-type domain-containing protein n=1 Tax=Dipteronia dyeriana TaxID=168575 RepID=A0AAD9XAK5_9ROSI|nr:hypothetical protein Ddye_008870 [Dipteronia dyeriana]